MTAPGQHKPIDEKTIRAALAEFKHFDAFGNPRPARSCEICREAGRADEAAALVRAGKLVRG